MSETGSPTLAWLCGFGAGLLFLLDLALSATLVAVSALSRVTLHRLGSEEGSQHQFLEELASPSTSYSLAARLSRQISLLGGCILTGAAAYFLDWPSPWLFGLAVAGLVGVLVVETLLAHLLALRYPKTVLRTTAFLLRGLHVIGYPFLAPFVSLVNRARRGAPGSDENGEEEQEAEAEALIEVAEKEGILEEEEGRMLRGIVDLGETRVREIMTPRTDILALPARVTVREALHTLKQASHTRLPVYRNSIDDVVGILHVRDLIKAWHDKREEDSITSYVRAAFFVPETLWVADLLEDMRTRTHIALVVDEYGGVAGLVTLEDLLEGIVGDIRDEHDLDETLVLEEPDNSWLVSGAAHVKELESFLELSLDGERAFDTVGGLVVSAFGRVPDVGEVLEAHGLHIEVVQADPRRVYRVRIRRAPGAHDPGLESKA